MHGLHENDFDDYKNLINRVLRFYCFYFYGDLIEKLRISLVSKA